MSSKHLPFILCLVFASQLSEQLFWKFLSQLRQSSFDVMALQGKHIKVNYVVLPWYLLRKVAETLNLLLELLERVLSLKKRNNLLLGISGDEETVSVCVYWNAILGLDACIHVQILSSPDPIYTGSPLLRKHIRLNTGKNFQPGFWSAIPGW